MPKEKWKSFTLKVGCLHKELQLHAVNELRLLAGMSTIW